METTTTNPPSPMGKEAAFGLAIVGTLSALVTLGVLIGVGWFSLSSLRYYTAKCWKGTDGLPPITKEVDGWFGPKKVPNVEWIGKPVEDTNRLQLVLHKSAQGWFGSREWCVVIIGTNNTLERLLVQQGLRWVEVPITDY